MSTSQFRIREFRAANDRLFVARDILSRGRAELECQENELTEALSRVDYLKKKVAAKKLLVQSDEKKLNEAELNLKKVEDRWQVHDVDDATDVTPSSPNKSTANASAAEDFIDIASPNSTRTTNINSSNVSLNNGDDEDFDNFFPNLSPLSNSSVNEDDHTSSANVQNDIMSDEEETGSYVNESVGATSSAPGNAFVNANNDEITINATAEKAFLFESIVVKSCGVPGANGKYKPALVLDDDDQVYSKPGCYHKRAAMFYLWHHVSHSHWRINVQWNGCTKNLYLSKEHDELKDRVPRNKEGNREWISTQFGVPPYGVPPYPIIVGKKNNQA